MSEAYKFLAVGGPLDGKEVDLSKTKYVYYEVVDGVCHIYNYIFDVENKRLLYRDKVEYEVCS